jgi:hypothetical protein
MRLLDGLETAIGSAMRVTGAMVSRRRRIVKQPAFEFVFFPSCLTRFPTNTCVEITSDIITGDDRDRTGNLRLAKPALSQLSYVPGRE